MALTEKQEYLANICRTFLSDVDDMFEEMTPKEKAECALVRIARDILLEALNP